MNRLIGIFQVVLALGLLLMVGATVVNGIMIAGRPESVSVANTLIGQFLIATCLAVASRLLWKKGLHRLRQAGVTPSP